MRPLAGIAILLLALSPPAVVCAQEIPNIQAQDAAANLQAGGVAYNAGNPDQAVMLWRLAAEQGNVAAQFLVGLAYNNGDGVPQDYTEAARWYHLAAEQGDAKSQSYLGTIYGTGQGVLQDYAEAMKWYRLAAEQGDVNAQYSLGIMYESARGVPQDYVEAVKWYRLAAEQGDANAQYNLGFNDAYYVAVQEACAPKVMVGTPLTISLRKFHDMNIS